MKKLISTTLILATLTSLVACSNTEESGRSSGDEALANVTFPLEETVTISMMTKEPAIVSQDPNEKEIFKRLEEETNVHIDWTCYVEDQFWDKRNLALAKPKSLPDVLYNAEFNSLDILKYADQGVIIPLNDMIESYMPNFQKILDENPNYEKLITAPDGNIYSFPWIEQLGVGKEAIQAIGGMPYINKTWLDELGLPVPQTTEELEQALIAFKSKGDNVIPMSFMINRGNEDLGFILGAFGYGDNSDHIMVDENGKVVYSLTDEGYKEGIAWLHSLQEQGLIDPEAFTQDWATYVAKGKNDQYGMFFGWDQFNLAQNPDDFVPLPALAGPTLEKNAPRASGSDVGGFQLGRTVVTANATQLEVIAKWIDLQYAPLQSVQNNWGTYDDPNNFNIFTLTENNTLEHNDLGENSPWESRVKQMVGGPLAILDVYYGEYVTVPPDAQIRMDNVKSYVADMKYDMVYPNVFMTQEDSEKLAKLETDIRSYGEQKKAGWILNGGIEEEWDEYLIKMEEYGLSKYLEIKQRYLDEYLGK